MGRQIILTEGVDPQKMMFSPAVAIEQLAWSSGSAGIDKQGKVPGPDIQSQARQAFENLGEAVQAAGSAWKDVVKVNCYLTHAARDFQGWNQVWKEYFPENPPARTTVGDGLLRDEWLLEVELVYVVKAEGGKMEKQLIIPEGRDVSKMVIAPGTKAGNVLYVSGSAGAKDGKLAGDDIVSQARQAMENLGVVLKVAGSSWDKVVKVNCFLVHAARDFQGWNQVWKEYFPQNPPARTTVGADIAMAGALIEVELIALVD
jgi:2-iminobutanoate/2-iminopropanoate deaminase